MIRQKNSRAHWHGYTTHLVIQRTLPPYSRVFSGFLPGSVFLERRRSLLKQVGSWAGCTPYGVEPSSEGLYMPAMTLCCETTDLKTRTG